MTARVLIAGAGIGGLAAALALLRAGHDVTVLEQARALRELGAGVQLGPNGTRVLFAIGVFNPPFGLLLVVVIGLAGIGIGGCQHGINALSGRVYPPAIRSTGAGWATGAGRGGSGRDILPAATLPALGVTLSMVGLGVAQRRLRGRPA